MSRFIVAVLFFATGSNAFVNHQFLHSRPSLSVYSKKSDGEVDQQHAFAAGTFVEFQEKNRVHVGKIASVEHKSNGGARYEVIDSEENHFGIADKAINFAIPAPNSPSQQQKLYDEFIAAQQISEEELQQKLEVSSELLEMAWEEAAEEELTPSSLIELVHAHAASAIEKYMAWKLLRTDMSHIFFKEIKDHGRVVSFKAKARKAVDNAKLAFCQSHEDSDLCLV